MKRNYHTIIQTGKPTTRKLAEFFEQGQMLLPMVDLIEQSRLAIDELIDVAGRATIERVLQLSGEQVAGPRTPGKQRQEVVWHGNQQGRACLKEHGSSQPGMPFSSRYN